MDELHIIDEALVAIIAAQTEEDVQRAVLGAARSLLPDSILVASGLLPDGDAMRVTATAGLDSFIFKAAQLLGADPTRMTYSLADMTPDDLAIYRTGRLERVPDGLYTLTLHKLPRAACRAVERLTGVRETWAVGFAWEGVHYGGLSIGLLGDAELTGKQVIETVAHVAAIAMRRLRAEAELEAATGDIDAFWHKALDLLCIADTGGQFRRLNPEWEATLGWPVAELEGRRFLDFVHPDDVDATVAAVGDLAAGKAVVKFVNRYRTRAGDYRWLEWRSFPRGELVYAAARDLTDRIETERRLRESEARYRLLADNAADVIWLLDLATQRFVYVSPSVERLRGYSAEEILENQTMLDVLTPESARQVAEALPRRLEAFARDDPDARMGVDEIDQWHKDGSVVATEATTTLLTDAEGRADRVLGVSRDITERRRAEAEIRALNESLEARVRERTAQLEAAVVELETFSYSVSHDLRAPLRAINGYATIVEEDFGEAIGADGRRLCDNIIVNTRRMGQLIDDLLAFSRVGRTQLAIEPIDMAALVRSVYEEITTEEQRDSMQFVLDSLAPSAGDPTLMRQAWANLLGNAFKFSAGSENPRIEVRSREHDGETVYSVHDNGAGFDMRHAGKLFQVFERLHGTRYEGTGIGLAIVRRVVEAHGGRVWAESAAGEGATFFFSLPSPPVA